MKILLTNDDGIFAPGLRAMRAELQKIGEVTVVAPAGEQSAVGHSITLLNPLLVEEVREEDDFIGYAVEGRPADCVKLGLVQLLKQRPDILVSGINAGSNAGINVLYSGTVAAAVEGAFFGVTSIAVSLTLPEVAQYPYAARLARQVVEDILNRDPRPGELFNVNLPELSKPPRGVRVAEQGLAFYKEWYDERTDPRGRKYYWLLPDNLGPQGETDSDLANLAEGYVTVTPLQFDLTDRPRLRAMSAWDWRSLPAAD
ncbi:MAG TPA: 5'/3'-nucleotidase SurE [Planctomycetia bacterium]|nr:5'/3'-nucleotidase SurE [Planctomycetia bacterium]